jgi:hypothetical protein
VSLRYSAFRAASHLFLNRDAVVRLAKRVARRSGVDQQVKDFILRRVKAEVEALSPELAQRVRGDVGLDASRAHLEDLVRLMEGRVDRLFRELAKSDSATSFEDESREAPRKRKAVGGRR